MDQRPLIFDTEANVRIDDFDIDEIIAALKKAKLNRAAGPDHIPVDFYKWLNAEALEVIRRFSTCAGITRYFRTGSHTVKW